MSAAPETAAPAPAPAPRPARAFALVWLAVSAVAVLAHFSLSARMGLYEDDHALIGVPMCEWGPAELTASMKGMILSYHQGRPLHCGLGFLLSYTGTHAGGITGAYVLAAAIWVLNVGLCLALLWRSYGAVAATLTALVFVLVPADTTHPLLHTAFFVHTSVAFMLLSGNAYARGRPLLAALCAALTLVTYETCFLPCLAWPLLFPSPTRSFLRRGLTHGLTLGAVLALAVCVRVAFGEERTAGAMSDKSAVPKKVKELALGGSKAAAGTFVTRPVWAVKAWKSPTAFTRHGPSRRTVGGLALGAGLVALAALVAARRTGRPAGPAEPPAEPYCVARLIAAGALMAVLGYVAALNREPNVVVGRMSSVHIASTLGWALLVGGCAAGAGQLLTRVRAGWLLPPAFAGYACLLAGFHVYVQGEYIRAWVAQGEFWQDVVAECPDVGPGTVILYPLVPPVSEMVHYQEWADHTTFRHLFAVPADWAAPPRAFPVGHRTWGVPMDYDGYDWNEVERDGDRLYLKHWDGNRPLLEPGNVILLKQVPGGRFERVTGTVRMAGVDLPLKPRGAPTFAFEPNRLHAAMFPTGTAPAGSTKPRVAPLTAKVP